METMALKGKPRDMNKWREVLLDPNVHFPQHDVPALVGRPTSGCPRGQDSRAAARRAAVPVIHIGRRRARGCCFSPRRADQPRRDREDKPRSARHLRTRTRLAQPAAAVLAEQHLQPRLPCGSTGRRAAPGPERVLTRSGRDPPPLGERDDDVQAGNTSSLDPVWPIYSALDLTRDRDSATYPSLQYWEVLEFSPVSVQAALQQ